ncbi:MAG: sigma-70 family RNA polymerase sigma factor, partial [Planctomycetota bacterium]|jgi:RNA polymerase sigma-70 factor (ECF subfamily)
VTRPSQNFQRKEGAAWVRIGLDLLEPAQREIIVLRQWEGLSFQEIGERLGITENTARMRFQRAVQRLAQIVRKARSGDVEV